MPEAARTALVAFPVTVWGGPGKPGRADYRLGTVVRTWETAGTGYARVRHDSPAYASGRGYFTRPLALLVPAGSREGRERLAAAVSPAARTANWERAGRPAHPWGPRDEGSGACWHCGQPPSAAHHRSHAAAPVPECVVPLAGGATVRGESRAANPDGTSYVRVCGPGGRETARWDSAAIAADPAAALGALLAAMSACTRPPLPGRAGVR